MPRIDDVLFCDGCGAEIRGAPRVHNGLSYCCELCFQGRDCDCALFLDSEERDGRSGQEAA